MAEGGDDDFTTPGYKPPAQVDLATLQNMDQDDEALNRWKAKLLEGVSTGDSSDPRRVIVTKMTFVTAEKEMDLDLTGDLSTLKQKPFTIKEGVQFRIKITFKVQHDVVSGLRYFDGVYRKGIRVTKNNYMLGSYGPKAEEQTAMTPWDEMPSGMLARGKYTVKSKFIDDDKNEHLAWEWAFELKKDW
jgi:Rho GDP-dissociation inhibitor